jgi:predicted nuclease of predicted toxin-antitoxin system
LVPTKVIWLRVRDVTTATVLKVLIDDYEVIEAFGKGAEEALLVMPGLPRE